MIVIVVEKWIKEYKIIVLKTEIWNHIQIRIHGIQKPGISNVDNSRFSPLQIYIRLGSDAGFFLFTNIFWPHAIINIQSSPTDITYLSVVYCFEKEPCKYFNSVDVDEILRFSIDSRFPLTFAFTTCPMYWLNSNAARFAWIWCFNGIRTSGPTPASSAIWTWHETRPNRRHAVKWIIEKKNCPFK